MGLRLDVPRLTFLLEKADNAWFLHHPGVPKYREHLSFVAGFVARHYNDKILKPNEAPRKVKATNTKTKKLPL